MLSNTNTENKPEWLGIHFFYEAPWEIFLTEAVSPFLEKIIEDKLIDQFFFIRYWERGPHIRLRLRIRKGILKDLVKQETEFFFLDYIATFPSNRGDLSGSFQQYDNEDRCPNNTIQWIDYKPEIERYGGEYLIHYAEQHFQSSSKAILAAMGKKKADWNYEIALGVGIQLHLGFLFGVSMSTNELLYFLHNLFRNWLPRAFSIIAGMTVEESTQKQNRITIAFEKSYSQQRTFLIPYIQKVWESFDAKIEIEDGESFHEWVKECKQMNENIILMKKHGHLQVPPWFKDLIKEQSIDREEFFIYESFFHMTNNRLGILNHDEGYLAYILQRSFQEIFMNMQPLPMA